MRKHMPASPENPRPLLDLLEAQTRTLSKIRVIPDHAKDDARLASFDAEAAEADIVASLYPLIVALSPEEKVLNRFVTAGSARALEMLFDSHGAEVYRDILENARPRSVSLGDPIKRGNVAFLKVFHEHGFDMRFYAAKMLPQAVRHQDPVYLSFIRDDLQCNMRIIDYASPRVIFDTPWPEILPEVEAELREELTKSSSIFRNMMFAGFQQIPQTPARLREAAICLYLIPRVGEIVETEGYPFQVPPLQRLLDMSRTSHGQLALHKMEPSLHDILARPETATFYGIAASDLS